MMRLFHPRSGVRVCVLAAGIALTSYPAGAVEETNPILQPQQWPTATPAYESRLSHETTQRLHEALQSPSTIPPRRPKNGRAVPKSEPAATTTPLATSSSVILLPPFKVIPTDAAYPASSNMLTAAGKVDLALKRHPGLRAGGALNEKIGLELLAEENANAGIAELNDLYNVSKWAGQSGTGDLKHAVQQTWVEELETRRFIESSGQFSAGHVGYR